MLKTLTSILLFICCTLSVQAKTIDELQTDEDVKNYLETIGGFDRLLLGTGLQEFKNGAKCEQELEVKAWYKADIDYDGKLDLLINGHKDFSSSFYEPYEIEYESYVFYILGKSPTEDHKFWRNDDCKYQFYSISNVNGESLIINNCVSRNDSTLSWKKGRDTLVYKFGRFIEYNPSPTEIKLDSLNVETTGCMFTCPNYQLSINKSGETRINVIAYVNDMQGEYKCVISQPELDSINIIFSYIKYSIEKLETYWLPHDVQYYTLYGNYNSGKVWDGHFMPMGTTPGYFVLCNYIEEMVLRQKWVKVE